MPKIIVTLCGSARFENEFIVANRELGRCGIPVFGLSCLPRDREPDAGVKADGYEKTMLDLVHLQKILAATHVLVVGDGYIGQSTAREIVWAKLHRIPVLATTRYPDPITPGQIDWAALRMDLILTLDEDGHIFDPGIIDRAITILADAPAL